MIHCINQTETEMKHCHLQIYWNISNHFWKQRMAFVVHNCYLHMLILYICYPPSTIFHKRMSPSTIFYQKKRCKHKKKAQNFLSRIKNRNISVGYTPPPFLRMPTPSTSSICIELSASTSCLSIKYQENPMLPNTAEASAWYIIAKNWNYIIEVWLRIRESAW